MTELRSNAERLMTLSTSAVAVCCCSDSLKSSVRWRNSFSRRVFSMAMTACLAKLSTSAICLSVNGRTSCRKMVIAPINSASFSMGTTMSVRAPAMSPIATTLGSPAR